MEASNHSRSCGARIRDEISEAPQVHVRKVDSNRPVVQLELRLKCENPGKMGSKTWARTPENGVKNSGLFSANSRIAQVTLSPLEKLALTRERQWDRMKLGLRIAGRVVEAKKPAPVS